MTDWLSKSTQGSGLKHRRNATAQFALQDRGMWILSKRDEYDLAKRMAVFRWEEDKRQNAGNDDEVRASLCCERENTNERAERESWQEWVETQEKRGIIISLAARPKPCACRGSIGQFHITRGVWYLFSWHIYRWSNNVIETQLLCKDPDPIR